MGKNLPLKTRRGKARGFGAQNLRFWSGRKTTGDGNRASLTTSHPGANNDVRIMAKRPGTSGNAITFRIVVAGANTPASVGVVGNAITFNSATNGASAATSTAAQMASLVNFDRSANPLVWVNPNIPR